MGELAHMPIISIAMHLYIGTVVIRYPGLGLPNIMPATGFLIQAGSYPAPARV